jgi:hypothetical protein
VKVNKNWTKHNLQQAFHLSVKSHFFIAFLKVDNVCTHKFHYPSIWLHIKLHNNISLIVLVEEVYNLHCNQVSRSGMHQEEHGYKSHNYKRTMRMAMILLPKHHNHVAEVAHSKTQPLHYWLHRFVHCWYQGYPLTQILLPRRGMMIA